MILTQLWTTISKNSIRYTVELTISKLHNLTRRVFRKKPIKYQTVLVNGRKVRVERTVEVIVQKQTPSVVLCSINPDSLKEQDRLEKETQNLFV